MVKTGAASSGALGIENGPDLLTGSTGVTGLHIEGKRWEEFRGWNRTDSSTTTSESVREPQDVNEGRNVLGNSLGKQSGLLPVAVLHGPEGRGKTRKRAGGSLN